MGKATQDWPVQWHITADGSAIKSYPKAMDHSNPQQEPPKGSKYLRYEAARPLELSELYALDAELARSNQRSDRLGRITMIVGGAGLVGAALAWLVFPVLGLEGAAANVLFTVSIPLMVLGVVGLVVVPIVMRRNFERCHSAHGLASATPKVLKEPEAKTAIDAPGTVSGPSAGSDEAP